MTDGQGLPVVVPIFWPLNLVRKRGALLGYTDMCFGIEIDLARQVWLSLLPLP